VAKTRILIMLMLLKLPVEKNFPSAVWEIWYRHMAIKLPSNQLLNYMV